VCTITPTKGLAFGKLRLKRASSATARNIAGVGVAVVDSGVDLFVCHWWEGSGRTREDAHQHGLLSALPYSQFKFRLRWIVIDRSMVLGPFVSHRRIVSYPHVDRFEPFVSAGWVGDAVTCHHFSGSSSVLLGIPVLPSRMEKDVAAMAAVCESNNAKAMTRNTIPGAPRRPSSPIHSRETRLLLAYYPSSSHVRFHL
jgi:hypothetical protein